MQQESPRLSNTEVAELVMKNIRMMLKECRGIKDEEIEISKTSAVSSYLSCKYKRRNRTLMMLYIHSTLHTIEREGNIYGQLSNFIKNRLLEKKGEMERCFQLMLVLKGTPMMTEELKNFKKEHPNLLEVELFSEEDFRIFKPSYHHNPRSVRILNSAESERVLNKYIKTETNIQKLKKRIEEDRKKRGSLMSITNTQEEWPVETKSMFPPIDYNDPLARYWDLQIGEMLEILQNITPQVDHYYLVCILGN
jgi:DNA-directed RNA polymerase subunit H (RpoH/RPB5)